MASVAVAGDVQRKRRLKWLNVADAVEKCVPYDELKYMFALVDEVICVACPTAIQFTADNLSSRLRRHRESQKHRKALEKAYFNLEIIPVGYGEHYYVLMDYEQLTGPNVAVSQYVTTIFVGVINDETKECDNPKMFCRKNEYTSRTSHAMDLFFLAMDAMRKVGFQRSNMQFVGFLSANALTFLPEILMKLHVFFCDPKFEKLYKFGIDTRSMALPYGSVERKKFCSIVKHILFGADFQCETVVETISNLTTK